jgi:replicative DNA helicase
MARFTKYDEEMIEIMSDPAKWAAHHLGEPPRWYQEEILKHPHHRKILRCGRRIGKTWTMTAHMLWVAFTCNGGKNIKKGATCLVATPYDSQAREIFDQLKTFIENNPILAQSVDTMTKNPYLIKFKNNSRIKLFTAGTRSGAEGGSMRGQKADWLYLDEMDYLSDKDFETIFAISMEAPDRIGIMAASTPTGRRGMFYNICTQQKFKNYPEAIIGADGKIDDENLGPEVPITYNREEKLFQNVDKYRRKTAKGWVEFYFPTMVNPEWNPNMEAELRGMYTQMAYEHEILAEFGTEMVGVFNKDFIDEAASISYPFLNAPQHNGPICIGIDWDKYGTATQIVVTQYEPSDSRRVENNIWIGDGRFRIIQRVEIPKSELTYDNAVKEVMRLDRIYNPAFIYPDRGAGEYQIEMLRKALGDKVKGIHLGSSYEVRDPISRVFERKPIKPFMVNQAVLLLERGMLRIPSVKVDEEVFRQMTNYQVVKIAAKTGEATFTNKDEHALDAFMLSLLAFTIEMPELTNTIFQIEVARTMFSAKTVQYDPLKELSMGRGTNTLSKEPEWDEPGPAPLKKVRLGYSKAKNQTENWASRGSSGNAMRGRPTW